MKNKKIIISLLFLIISVSLITATYSTNETVISSGGNNISGTDYTTDVTVSQISGNTSAGSYTTGLGFLYLTLNNLPLFTTIPTQTWDQDTTKTIDLSTYSSDIDNDELNYTSTSPGDIVVSIDNNTKIVTLTPTLGFYGTRYITFSAHDGYDTSDSNQVTLIVSEVTPEGPGPGGGGGEDETKSFSVDTDLIHLLLKQGETQRETVTVKNTGDLSLSFTINTSELDELVIVDENNFALESGEEKILNFDFYASETYPADVYTGRIKITGSEIEKIINTIVEVVQKEALFDINLIIFQETKEVEPGDKVKANITMINLGDLQNIDVGLEFTIKSMSGEIIDNKHETLAVLGDSEKITREFKIPRRTIPGDYILYVKLTHNESIATASDTFKVIEKEKPTINEQASDIADEISDALGDFLKTLGDILGKIPELITGIGLIIIWIPLLFLVLIYFIIRKYIKIRNQLAGHKEREDKIVAINKLKQASRKANFFEKIVDKMAISLIKGKTKSKKKSKIKKKPRRKIKRVKIKPRKRIFRRRKLKIKRKHKKKIFQRKKKKVEIKPKKKVRLFKRKIKPKKKIKKIIRIRPKKKRSVKRKPKERKRKIKKKTRRKPREEVKIKLPKKKRLYLAGVNLYKERDYKKALKKFKKSIRKDKNFWQGYQAIGNCYFKLGKIKKTIKAYEKTLSINPNNVKVQLWLRKYREEY